MSRQSFIEACSIVVTHRKQQHTFRARFQILCCFGVCRAIPKACMTALATASG